MSCACHFSAPRVNGHGKHRDRSHGFDATSSIMSSDIDTTSFFDSDEDSRFDIFHYKAIGYELKTTMLNIVMVLHCIQSQKAVSGYFTTKQILSFGSAEQHAWEQQNLGLL